MEQATGELKPTVVDASAIIDLLLHPAEVPWVGAHLQGSPSLLVPHACDLEVASSLRRALMRRWLGEGRAGQALLAYLDLPLRRCRQDLILGRVLRLRDNFTAFDAAYVALAEAFGAKLLTTDAGLARATATHTDVPVVEWVSA